MVFQNFCSYIHSQLYTIQRLTGSSNWIPIDNKCLQFALNPQAPVHLQAKLIDQGQDNFQGENFLISPSHSIALDLPEISQNCFWCFSGSPPLQPRTTGWRERLPGDWDFWNNFKCQLLSDGVSWCNMVSTLKMFKNEMSRKRWETRLQVSMFKVRERLLSTGGQNVSSSQTTKWAWNPNISRTILFKSKNFL